MKEMGKSVKWTRGSVKAIQGYLIDKHNGPLSTEEQRSGEAELTKIANEAIESGMKIKKQTSGGRGRPRRRSF